MRVLLLGLAALITLGCTGDKTVVINNTDRVKELERRADLNDQLNDLQNQRLDALEAALQAEEAARIAADLQLSADLQAEMDARIAADQDLADLVAAEEAARIAGDANLQAQLQIEINNRIAGDNANSAALAASVFMQSLVNFAVQGQISLINSKINTINSKINNLTVRVSDLESDLDDLQDEVNQLASDMAALQLNLQAQIDDLQDQVNDLSDRLDQEGVKVFKCNAANSTERILKINGKFYAVMNRVTTETVQVITGSSSQTFTTPNMCQTWNGDLKLPNSGGQCTPNGGPFASTLIPGQSIVVPSYTTKNLSVVKSVKIALDLLTDGSYQTTDGGPACTFSISGGGSSSSNLIQVQ